MQAADIGTMRNLDLSAFVDGQVIWDAVATWMERSVNARSGIESQMPKLLLLAAESGTAWADALWKGLDRTILQGSLAAGHAYWSWWQKDISLVKMLFARLPAETAFENLLQETYPRALPADMADAIMDHAAQRAWYRLHGRSCRVLLLHCS